MLAFLLSLLSPPSPPSRRGFIMGIWNSHTSVGNILGTLIAGVWVSGPWGLSFVVPGIITAAMGIFTFLFLIECEWTPSPGPITLGEGSWLWQEVFGRRTGGWLCAGRDEQPLSLGVPMCRWDSQHALPGQVRV